MCKNKITTESFIEKAKLIHGDKFDYNLVDYINSYTKIKIICSEHGIFEQQPNSHLNGAGCPFCSGRAAYTNETFIKKAREIHGDKYNYLLINYKSFHHNIDIICNTCNTIFSQNAGAHIRGQNCKKCTDKNKELTLDEFIERSIIKHGNKYNYHLVEYRGMKTKVPIICPIHNIFYQTPHNHIKGKGCKKCGIIACHEKQKLPISEFIIRANNIHNNKYDYSKVEYETILHNIEIGCPEHGYFKQIGSVHLNGAECPKCAGVYRKNTEDFINEAKLKHGDKFDYSLVQYINAYTSITIICPIHGKFIQNPRGHIKSPTGCPECTAKLNGDLQRSNTQEFINKAIKKHGDGYNYDLVEYQTAIKKVKIKCNRCKNIFEQTPNDHLYGSGCANCNCNGGVLETKVLNIIKSEFNKYEVQSRVKLDWLKYNKSYLSLDIYIPELKIAIEYQGYQHFKPVEHWGGNEGFKANVKRDNLKNKLCKENGIKLFYFSYDLSYVPKNYPYIIYNNELDLIKMIREGI